MHQINQRLLIPTKHDSLQPKTIVRNRNLKQLFTFEKRSQDQILHFLTFLGLKLRLFCQFDLCHDLNFQ
jgi:hypothetical protein